MPQKKKATNPPKKKRASRYEDKVKTNLSFEEVIKLSTKPPKK